MTGFLKIQSLMQMGEVTI